MRLFAFILSLFILTLSFVPCSDNEDCNTPDLSLNSDHSDHDHNEDSCTPFCSCSCCGIPGLILSSPIFYTVLQELKMPTPAATVYYSDLIPNYFYSFWQPPRI